MPLSLIFLDLLEYVLKKVVKEPGMVMFAFNPSAREAEFKASLVYIPSSRTARAIECDLVPKKRELLERHKSNFHQIPSQ